MGQLAAVGRAWVEPTAAVLTQIGDAWFFGAVLVSIAVLSLHRGRPVGGLSFDRVVLLAGLTVLAFGLTGSMKELFAHSRPPGAGLAIPPGWLPGRLSGIYEWLATGTGFGFPSGHALTGTAFFGGFALLSEWRTRSVRLALAAGGIVVASGTRLILGVHYPIDIIVGVTIGLILLGTFVVTRHNATPERIFGLATVICVGGTVLVGPTLELVVTALVAGTGTVIWTWWERAPT